MRKLFLEVKRERENLENRGPKLIAGRGILNEIGYLETDYPKTYRRVKYVCIMTLD